MLCQGGIDAAVWNIAHYNPGWRPCSGSGPQQPPARTRGRRLAGRLHTLLLAAGWALWAGLVSPAPARRGHLMHTDGPGPPTPTLRHPQSVATIIDRSPPH